MNPEQKEHSYDIIIPICKPGKEFDRVLEMLKKQEPAPAKIILLETLEDGEPLVPYPGCEVVAVKKKEFDHAATRRLGVSRSCADTFIFLTQDARPRDTKLCANLLQGLYSRGNAEKNSQNNAQGNTQANIPNYSQAVAKNEYDVESIRDQDQNSASHEVLPEGRIAMCYARQVAAEDSTESERFIRCFNYPEESFTKSILDVPKMGIKAFFASNVCCAYDRGLYESLQGFASDAIFNEDMLYAAKAIKQGCSIAYAADAVVVHSHNYSAMQQFHRMFDNGMSQAMHPEVFEGIPSEGEGMRMVKEGLAHLLATGHPLQAAELIWQSGFKYLGFRMGKQYAKYDYQKLRRLAMNKTYIDRYFRN